MSLVYWWDLDYIIRTRSVCNAILGWRLIAVVKSPIYRFLTDESNNECVSSDFDHKQRNNMSQMCHADQIHTHMDRFGMTQANREPVFLRTAALPRFHSHNHHTYSFTGTWFIISNLFWNVRIEYLNRCQNGKVIMYLEHANHLVSGERERERVMHYAISVLDSTVTSWSWINVIIFSSTDSGLAV